MADSDSSKNKMADETEVASSESDMECGKVSGTTESGDRTPSVGVSADYKMEYESSAVEKTVKSATTSKSDVAKDEMECEGKLDEPKCTEIRGESIETAEADVESLAHSEWKDEIASEDAAGKPQSADSNRSLKDSADTEGKPAETSTKVDELGFGDQEQCSLDSGDLADGSNHSTNSLSSTSSERTRPEIAQSETNIEILVLKPATLSFPTATSSKAKEMETEESTYPNTSSEDSERDSYSVLHDKTKPKVVHVEFVVMKEAEEAELKGEVSLEEMSETSAVLGLEPEQEHSNVELPMEQDESAMAMSESMQSDAEVPCSHDGGKRRMESSDEGQSECTSPLKRRNKKPEETD